MFAALMESETALGCGAAGAAAGPLWPSTGKSSSRLRNGAGCCDAAPPDLAAEGAGAPQRAGRAPACLGAAGSGGNAVADEAAGDGSCRAVAAARGGCWELLGAAEVWGSAGKGSEEVDAEEAALRCSALSRCCCWMCLGCGAATSCHSGSLGTSACNNQLSYSHPDVKKC